MEAPHRLHQDSLHYNNRYPTSADAFAAPQEFNNQLLFFLYHWDPALLPFSRTGRLELLIFFPFSSLISHGNRRKKQTAPSTAKGKRKCDDTNSTYEHTRTRKQHKVNICCGSGFFSPASLFFCFTCFLILFVIRGMEESGGNWAGIHDRGSREERKKERENAPAWHRQTHTRTCCGNY